MVFGMNYAGGQRGPEALALSLWMTPQAQHHRGFLGVKTYTATQAGMGVGVTGEARGMGGKAKGWAGRTWRGSH